MPIALAQLRKLRRLSIWSNMRSIPDEIFLLPELEEVWLDGRLPKAYDSQLLSDMLNGFRARAAVTDVVIDNAQRLIELQLLLGNRKRLEALGPPAFSS